MRPRPSSPSRASGRGSPSYIAMRRYSAIRGARFLYGCARVNAPSARLAIDASTAASPPSPTKSRLLALIRDRQLWLDDTKTSRCEVPRRYCRYDIK